MPATAAAVLLAALSATACCSCCRSDWCRSSRCHTSSNPTRFLIPWCHSPMFFATVTQSYEPVTSILKSKPLVSFSIGWNSLSRTQVREEAVPQVFERRPASLGPCTASRPIMMRFGARAPSCRARVPANDVGTFWRRSQHALIGSSRAQLCTNEYRAHCNIFAKANYSWYQLMMSGARVFEILWAQRAYSTSAQYRVYHLLFCAARL